jgi:oligopeptide transport system ATP-binding protein
MGQDLGALPKGKLRELRQDMQIIFQDPLASLDPRMTVGDIIGEPLATFFPKMAKSERRAKVQEIMIHVGLMAEMVNRFPHEFSGGQAQRIGIARAMILRPKLIVCDEPVSALDVSIQAQVINLLMRLQREFNLSLIFISHDLSVVRHISDRILVLYLGKVMEVADRDEIYDQPRHPYTRALISAVPIPDPDLERAKPHIVLTGDLPSPLSPPSGCVFRTRCPLAAERCAVEVPELDDVSPTHRAACHFWRDSEKIEETS